MTKTSSSGPHSAGAIERHIGSRLKTLRQQQSLSQAGVEKRTGLPAGTCQLLEQGDILLEPTQLYTLARAFAVEPSYFFDDLPANDIVPLEKSSKVRETENLIKAFQNIEDAALRKSIIGLFNAVAEDPSYGENIAPLR